MPRGIRNATDFSILTLMPPPPEAALNDSPGIWWDEPTYAWLRLLAALTVSTIGGVGMWCVVVALPSVQADFGVARGDASLPYTLTMIGFGLGGIALGMLADRQGVMRPILIGAIALAGGYIVAASTATIWTFALAQGILIGVGSSATFSPLIADTSLWFHRRRGIAIAIFASGNYLAGTIWPPIVQHFIATSGWRATYFGIGVFCAVTMLPLAFVLRRRPFIPESHAASPEVARSRERPLGLSPTFLHVLLMVAGVGCCVAMSMPQAHLVAYCADLGYGPARGAQMLSLMLACGVVSRVTFGWVSDHIGGLRTLLIGSVMQGTALMLFIPFDGLASLFFIAAMFGLFQGGIVPSYAMIIREFFSPKEAGSRIAAVITATIFGMALGGWMSGVIFDWTGSYNAAFINGVAWNALNLAIAFWLLRRSKRMASAA
jgi:MFS family permease